MGRNAAFCELLFLFPKAVFSVKCQIITNKYCGCYANSAYWCSVLVFPSWMQHPLVTQLISTNNSAEHINLLLHVDILPLVLSQHQQCHKRFSELLFYKTKQNREVGTYIITKNSRTWAESKYFAFFVSSKWNAWRRSEAKGEDGNRRACQRGQWGWELSESPRDILKALLR